MTLLCAGCGGSVADTPSPSPTPDAPAVSIPVHEPEPAAPGPEEETPDVTVYTLDRTTTVDGRELTLRLHGRVDATDGYERIGITALDVLEGETLLQTLSIPEAYDAMYRQQGVEELIGSTAWTSCWTEDGSLTTEDLNFDGFPDLRLMDTAGVVNINYLCWLWDPERGQFTYAFSLLGYDVQIDSDTQQLVTQTRDAAGQYDTDYYRYDNGSKELLHLKQVHVDLVAQTTTIYEWIDGIWTQTG